jgi:hypothetical protein
MSALDLVYAACDAVPPSVTGIAALRHAADAQLVGPGSPLDSLGLVSLLVTVEEEVERRFGRPVGILDVVVGDPARVWRLGDLADLIAARVGRPA